MDALSAGISRRVTMQPFFKKLIFKSEAKRLIKYERHIFDFFENKTIISEQDKNLIHHPERANIVCVPNGIDKSFFEAIKRTAEYDFVFVGNMNYPPNVDAVHYIVEKIMPSFPEATLLVSGVSPRKSLVTLAKINPRITLTGWVHDIRTSYSKGKIFLAPMFIGTGMQNKLLEAMAMKIPCVTTPLANNAIHARNKIEIMVGKNEEEIISCIKKLRQDPQFSSDLANAASSFVKTNYSWQETVSALKEIILK
jgi:glycosyltransferase involved in cell wall biosynthesis